MPPDTTFAPREMLSSDEAERGVIAAALYSTREAEDALDRLRPDHFADAVQRRIWERVTHLHRSGRTPTPAHIRDALGFDEGFEEWGGVDALVMLEHSVDLRIVGEHVDTLVDRLLRRDLRKLTMSVEARASDTACASGEELLAELERGAVDIANGSTTADAFIHAGDVAAAALKNAAARNGRIDFTFGIKSLDELTNGLHAGESTVLAAWTGMGKTLAALHVAVSNAMRGVGVCYFSLEMAEDPMGVRLLCNLAYRDKYDEDPGPTVDSVVKNLLAGVYHRERLWEAQDRLAHMPLLLDVRHGLTVPQIEAAARRQHRKWVKAGIKPGPIIVDHIGKIRPSERYRGNRTGEIEEASNELMGIAKRLGVPVVPLVQLNRSTETQAGEDKRPTLTSLKQSGAIAEDARQVVFLYRPEYYYRPPLDHEEHEAKVERVDKLNKVKGDFYWVVAKNSHGPIDQVKSYCDAGRSVVREWPGG